MSESGKTFIDISKRAYTYIRQAAIRDVEDAVVELITNSDDAYNRKKQTTQRKIEIEVSYPNKLVIRDHATGLEGSRMKECFLQVGEYTSTKESRGFFSRGAKDISILGEVTFETIKDDKYSRCVLDVEACGEVEEADTPATEEIRERLKIPENGLQVTLQLTPEVSMPKVEKLQIATSQHFSLRQIVKNPLNKITLDIQNNPNGGDETFEVKFEDPVGDLLVDIEFLVQGYNVPATFKVYKAEKPIRREGDPRYNRFGIIIQSYETVHDLTFFHRSIEQNPNSTYLYGVLKCDYINDLMLDLDKNGPSKSNPWTVIDPSRISGIRLDHPFCRRLKTLPVRRLTYILKMMDKAFNDVALETEDISEFVKELGLAGGEIIESEETNLFLKSPDGNLIHAIETDREKFVQVERNFSHNVLTRWARPKKSPSKETGNRPLGYIFSRNDEGKLIRATIITEGNIIKEDDMTETQKLESNVRVNADEKLLFDLSFSRSPALQGRYEIYNDGRCVHLRVNLNHPLVEKYITPSTLLEDLRSLKTSKGGIFLSELVISAFSKLLVEKDIYNKDLNLADLSDHDRVLTIFRDLDENSGRIEMFVHSLLEKYVSLNKVSKKEQLATLVTGIETRLDQSQKEIADMRKLRLQIQTYLSD